jgi:hypothetical protein
MSLPQAGHSAWHDLAIIAKRQDRAMRRQMPPQISCSLLSKDTPTTIKSAVKKPLIVTDMPERRIRDEPIEPEDILQSSDIA